MSSNQELININNIYSNNGNVKKDWELFIKDINNDSYVDQIIFLLQKNMKEMPKNQLTLDIIDLIIDHGSQKSLFQIAQKSFLDTVLDLLKTETNAGIEIQKEVIYLVQKWAKKFYNNKNFSIFMENYTFLKNNGIVYPPENFVIKTYDKFISQEEIKNSLSNNQNNFSNQFGNNNSNQNDGFPGQGNNDGFPRGNNNNNNFPMQNNDNGDGFPRENNNNNFPMQNNKNDSDGFPRQNSNNNFPMQNDNNNGFPMQNNDGFPRQNSNNIGGFPMGDNNNMSGFPMGNNNNNNYNFSNNYQNDFNNNNYGNNNNHFGNNNNLYNVYDSFGDSNDNNNFGNQQFNNNNFSSNNMDPNSLIEYWKPKIKTYNQHISEGKFSFHASKLKDYIREILNSLPKVNDELNHCFTDYIRRDLSNIKSDMEQTCYRYECLNNNRKVEPFQSAFDGNSRKYFFDAKNLLSEKSYIPYSNVEEQSPTMSGLEKFGNTIKEGAFYVGRKIKDAAVGGYDYVKEKMG